MRFQLTEDLVTWLEGRVQQVVSQRPIADVRAYEIASRHGALLLLRGLKEDWALRITGEVLTFRGADLDHPRAMFLRGRAYGAIKVASGRYPELGVLLPSRSPEDTACELCQGTGVHPLRAETKDDRVVCECGGLGFHPSHSPEGEPQAPPYTGSVFPDILPSTYKSSYFYHIDADYDVQSDEELNGLLNTMLDDPEHEVVYYRPRGRAGNPRIESAIREKVIVEGELEFFHYRRGPADRNFVRIERSGDDSHAECLFGYEKRDILWQQQVSAGEMYARTTLALTDRARRLAETERARDRNPFEAKPGAFGFSVDLVKLWAELPGWYRRWRDRKRRGPK